MPVMTWTEYQALPLDWRNACYAEAQRLLSAPIAASDKPRLVQLKRAYQARGTRAADVGALAYLLAQDDASCFRICMTALVDSLPH